MWKKLKSRTCVNWGIFTMPDMDRAVKRYLRTDVAKKASLSVFVENAVMDYIDRETERMREECIKRDRLCLSDNLSVRKEREGHRRTIRWCILVSVESDAKIRKFLRTYKARKGAMVRLIEDAVLEAMLRDAKASEDGSSDTSADMIAIAAAAMWGSPSGSGAGLAC